MNTKFRNRLVLVAALLALTVAGLFPSRRTATLPASRELDSRTAAVRRQAPVKLLGHTPGNTSAGVTAPTAPAPAPAVPGPFRYRLTNTTDSVDQLARNDRAILLRNALIDTSRPRPSGMPDALRAGDDPGGYIVQFRSAATDSMRAGLRAAGAEIVSYVPNNAYLVRTRMTSLASLRGLPAVRAVLPYEPYYKLDPELVNLVLDRKSLAADTLLKITTYPGDEAAAQGLIASLGGAIKMTERTPFGTAYTVQPEAGRWVEYAQSPVVNLVEPHRQRALANDLTRFRLGVAADAVVATNYLGLTGTNILVGLNDSGAEGVHPDLAGRVVGQTIDSDGHGTHVAGIIASSGTNSPTVTDAPGSPLPPVIGQYRGMAPEARIFSQSIDLLTGALTSDEQLQQNAALTNVFVSNNSWAYVGASDYNLAAASYDAAVRDSLPGITGSQPMVYVFAAGNSGGGANNGISGIADTISSPGTAKNVITVGAIENLRYITNEVVILNETNSLFLGLTDSPNQVASFSSRGNVGVGVEGDSGRYKPDVMAPGTFVVSTRSSSWTDPTTTVFYQIDRVPGVEVPAGSTNIYQINIPVDGVALSIRVQANPLSPKPFPPINIYATTNLPFLGFAPGDFKGTGLANFRVDPGVLTFGLENPGKQPVNLNLQTIIVISNDSGNLTVVLKQLNDALGPYYRYDSGTSMAAPAVTGVLALMQELFEQRLFRTNSPALMKALLINGARPVSSIYDYQVARFSANDQGWGLVSLSNSLPAAFLASTNETDWPIRFFDQNPTNALATGESHTRLVTNSLASDSADFRVTLVWTDPPGNPAAGVKLVNDLDLIVTNLTTGDVYTGNNFPAQDIYTLSDSNLVSDVVNNVENVFIKGDLAAENTSNTVYSITVRATRVNVNAVTTHTNGTVQDYALVISTGNLSLTNVFAVSDLPGTNVVYQPSPTVLNITNGVPVYHQRVGANSPLIGDTRGVTNQWQFYTFTNSVTDGTNVAFITFYPPNLSRPRAVDADIDLYVSTNPALTNLDPVVLATADRSVGRSGTEFVAYTNAPLGLTYYIGVKSEDAQGGDFGLFAYAASQAFSDDDGQGNKILHGIPFNGVNIPDGSPDQPGGNVFFALGLGVEPVNIRRAIVTNVISHEFMGDLLTRLDHNQVSTVLLNHTSRGTNFTQGFIYEDNGEGDITGAQHTDGPGTLRDYIGQDGLGVWLLSTVDNALNHTGRVDSLSIKLEPVPSTNDFVETLGPNSWFYTFVDVPNDGTNLTVTITYPGSAPAAVGVYIRKGDLPDTLTYDKGTNNIPVTGGSLGYSIYDIPPLTPGRQYIGIFNGNSSPVTVRVRITIDRSLLPDLIQTFANTNKTQILDDATLTSSLTVSNSLQIVGAVVGLRIDHDRSSDLAVHLISPQGTRVLLTENRGLTNATGYGFTSTNVVTNVVSTVVNSGFESAPGGTILGVGTVFEGWTVTNGTVEVITNGGGFISFAGLNTLDLNGTTAGTIETNLATTVGTSYRVSFAYTHYPATPASALISAGSLSLTVNANQANTAGNLNWVVSSAVFVASAPSTPLRLTSLTGGASGVLFDAVKVEKLGVFTNEFINYAFFTDDTNRAHVPIKFASPPYGSNVVLVGGSILSSGFEGLAPATKVGLAGLIDGWTVATNTVEVLNGLATANQGSNALALSSGSIEQSLPTLLGRKYRLDFAIHDRGNVAWWRAEGNGKNVVGGTADALTNGIVRYTNGYIGGGFFFPGIYPSLTDYVVSPASAALNVGTNGGFTIEGWIRPTVTNLAQAIFEWNFGSGAGVAPIGVHLWMTAATTAGDLYANLRDTSGGDHSFATPSGVVSPGVFQHVALTYDQASGVARIFRNGSVVASTNLGSFIPQTSFPLYFGNRVAGTIQGAAYGGIMDEIGLYKAALTVTEVAAIYNAGTAGKIGPSVSPSTQVLLDQAPLTNVVASGVWQTNTAYFNAKATTTDLQFDGRPLGLLLDSIQLTLLPQTNSTYYLPEEPLKPLIGENAQGVWQLEVWDNRVGAPLGANLVAWNLQLTFAPSAITLIPLTNSVPSTNAIIGTQVAYFAVDVPAGVSLTTNALTSLTGGGLDLLFNASQLPLLSTGGDATLFGGVTTSNSIVLDNGNTPPAFVSGQRYFLAVRNSNPGQSNQFILQVDFGPAAFSGVTIIPLTSITPLATNILATTNFQYYSFDASPLVDYLKFELLSLNGDADLYVARAPKLPTTAVYDYASGNAGTNNELIVVTTNSLPSPSAAGTWYIGVRNFAAANPINYTVLVTEVQKSFASGGLKIFSSQFVVAAGQAQIPIGTTPGKTYRVDWSADLKDWYPLTTFTATGASSVITDNAPSTGQTSRFYRIVELVP